MILISPWSRNTTDAKPSPKNYPYWDVVAHDLLKAGYLVTQVSCSGEPDVRGIPRMNDLPLEKISELMKSCDTWVAVDNFWPHMAWTLGEPGVAIFGMSDPEIFGHPENVNLLKDRRFLRTRQFGLWSQEPQNPDSFISPAVVLDAVRLSISKRRGVKGF